MRKVISTIETQEEKKEKRKKEEKEEENHEGERKKVVQLSVMLQTMNANGAWVVFDEYLYGDYTDTCVSLPCLTILWSICQWPAALVVSFVCLLFDFAARLVGERERGVTLLCAVVDYN